MYAKSRGGSAPWARWIFCWLLGGLAGVSNGAENWPALRGPGGSGVSGEADLPLEWSTNRNVLWQTALPDRGNSTPIVWGDRVFLTQAVASSNRREVICIDRRDGKKLWESGVTWTAPEVKVDDNPPCTPSPVTDGKRVIAWFGSAGVYCYDFAGRELWHRDLGPQAHQWGYASSLLLDHGRCIVNFGPGDRSFVTALDAKNGRTVWQFNIPVLGETIDRQALGGPDPATSGPAKLSEIAGSWATPILVPAPGGDEVVVALPLRLVGLAPKTGKLLWSCEGPNIGAYSSPFYGEGYVAYGGCGFRNTLMVVRPGGRGDVSRTHRLWVQNLANSQAHLGAGIIFEGHLYLVNTAGIVECFELQSGKLLWSERLRSTGARGSSWSSPVLAGNRLYVPNRNADVFVLKAGPTFELLAVNSIGSETMNASLAVSHSEVFIRTEKNLWCVGSSAK